MPRSRTHADSRVTDPHGIPPVPPEADEMVPRQRTGRPSADPWDPAYVPDPRPPAAYPDDVDLDERYADDRYAGRREPDEWYADEAHPDAYHVEEPHPRRGGDGRGHRTVVEEPIERPARRRARARAEEQPRRARRAQSQRQPHADTFVGDPEELAQDGGGLRFMSVAIPVAIGSLVAVGIGAWARTSDPTGVAVNIAGFSSAGAVKTWLATLAMVFALVQLGTAMMMRGRIGSGRGARTAMVHRWAGRIAVLITVPVAVQCLIAMGWSGASTRTLVHSLLGCVFYGAFVTKMLLLRRRGVPGWLIALSGGLLLAVLAGIWLTSALWFFGTKGLTF